MSEREPEACSHIAPAVKEQREMKADAQLAFFYLFSPEPHLWGAVTTEGPRLQPASVLYGSSSKGLPQ